MFISDVTKGLAADCQGTMSQPCKIEGLVLQQHRCEDKRTWLCTPDRCSVCIVISLLQLAGACEPMMQKPRRGMDITVVFCIFFFFCGCQAENLLLSSSMNISPSAPRCPVYCRLICIQQQPTAKDLHSAFLGSYRQDQTPALLERQGLWGCSYFFIKVFQDKRKSWNKMLMPSTLD